MLMSDMVLLPKLDVIGRSPTSGPHPLRRWYAQRGEGDVTGVTQRRIWRRLGAASDWWS